MGRKDSNPFSENRHLINAYPTHASEVCFEADGAGARRKDELSWSTEALQGGRLRRKLSTCQASPR